MHAYLAWTDFKAHSGCTQVNQFDAELIWFHLLIMLLWAKHGAAQGGYIFVNNLLLAANVWWAYVGRIEASHPLETNQRYLQESIWLWKSSNEVSWGRDLRSRTCLFFMLKNQDFPSRFYSFFIHLVGLW